jgi:quercetin dioxygenase-like cupin family protein
MASSPSLNVCAIADQIAAARQSAQWQSGDRFGVSIAKQRDLTTTLLLLKQGARLQTHSNPHSVAVQVLSGEIRFSAQGTDHTLKPGMILTLEHDLPHAVEAIAESAILLTAGLRQ